MQGSTARTVALLSAVGIVIGAIGPWWTTFLVDIAGTEGDGQITLLLALISAVIVLLKPAGSRLLLVAVVCGVLCAIVGIYDLVTVSSENQELFGQEVDLVSPGWGLWLTVIASVAFTVSTYMFKTEDPPSADTHSEPAP